MVKSTLIALLALFALQTQGRPLVIANVTVVPMDRERILENQTVVVRDGKIQTMGPSQTVREPSGAERVDGYGKFLMPGLTDMHVHFVRAAPPERPQSSAQNSGGRQPGIPASASKDHEIENRAYALMFVANGVTTVRNMWGSDTIDTFGREVDSGSVIGPHIYSTGPITDGNPPIWEGTRIVETAAQAEDAVRSDKRNGYVAVKVYGLLSNDAYQAIIGAAKRQGLPVVGHVPNAVGLIGVISARQDSIEHAENFLPALQPDRAQPKSTAEALEHVDLSKLPALVQAIRDAGVWVCPTTVVFDRPRSDPMWLEQASFVPPDVFVRYRRMYPNFESNPFGAPRGHDFNLAILTALHKGGAHLLLGTDTMKPGALPGLSLHNELENFVATGMSPYEAIRAGTADAAMFLHKEQEFGVVSPGRRADLLLLNANPLEDVKNTAKLAGVILNGRWLPTDEINRQLHVLREGYRH